MNKFGKQTHYSKLPYTEEEVNKIYDRLNQSHEEGLKAVKDNGLLLQYIENPTIEVQLAAVNENPWALECIENPSEEVCIAAVKQNGSLIEIIENQTEAICITAVSEFELPASLFFVKNKTLKVCLAAVKNQGVNLGYINDQTPELCEAAVDQNPRAIQYVINPSILLCLRAVSLSKDLDIFKRIVVVSASSNEECIEMLLDKLTLLSLINPTSYLIK